MHRAVALRHLLVHHSSRRPLKSPHRGAGALERPLGLWARLKSSQEEAGSLACGIQFASVALQVCVCVCVCAFLPGCV